MSRRVGWRSPLAPAVLALGPILSCGEERRVGVGGSPAAPAPAEEAAPAGPGPRENR